MLKMQLNLEKKILLTKLQKAVLFHQQKNTASRKLKTFTSLILQACIPYKLHPRSSSTMVERKDYRLYN